MLGDSHVGCPHLTVVVPPLLLDLVPGPTRSVRQPQDVRLVQRQRRCDVTHHRRPLHPALLTCQEHACTILVTITIMVGLKILIFSTNFCVQFCRGCTNLALLENDVFWFFLHYSAIPM